MKQIEPKKLRPDPLAAALAGASTDAMVVTGHVLRIGPDHVAISDRPGAPSSMEYPLDSVVAAFQDDDSAKTTLIVEGDAPVRMITTGTAQALRAPGAGPGGSGGPRPGYVTFCCRAGAQRRCVTRYCASNVSPFVWCSPSGPVIRCGTDSGAFGGTSIFGR